MIEYYTLYSSQKVYSSSGGEVGSIASANTRLTVIRGDVVIPNRGECYQITAPRVGYIPEPRVRRVVAVDPPPPPPPSDEYILHVKDGVTRKFVPE